MKTFIVFGAALFSLAVSAFPFGQQIRDAAAIDAASAKVVRASDYVRNVMYEEASEVLATIDTAFLKKNWNYSPVARKAYIQAMFYQLVCYYHTDQKEKAEKAAMALAEDFNILATDLQWRFPELAGYATDQVLKTVPFYEDEYLKQQGLYPRTQSIGVYSYFVLTRRLIDGLETWGQEDLNRVRQLMHISRDRLAVDSIVNERLGKSRLTPEEEKNLITQKEKEIITEKMAKQRDNRKKAEPVQKEIVRLLDKMIKEKEDQANGGGKGKGKEGEAGKAGQDGVGKNKSQKPLEDSKLASGEGNGTVDQKKLADIAGKWGQMPEKERAKAIMDITKDLPARYRVVIEDYFKALSKSK